MTHETYQPQGIYGKTSGFTAKLADDVQHAYAQGRLYTHMFEFDMNVIPGKNAEGQKQLKHMMDIMSGIENLPPYTGYHIVESHPEGFVGLPCTALHKDYPVRLFDIQHRVGLLMDGCDKEHVKPIMVGSTDLMSETRDGVLLYDPPEMMPQLSMIQQLKERPAEFRIDKDLPGMKERAEVAMDEFWKQIKQGGWNNYVDGQTTNRGMNEVSVNTQLKGVKGLLVNEIFPEGMPLSKRRDEYRMAVFRAYAVGEWLTKTYPETFPERPPIMSYNPNRTKDRLVELTKMALVRPELPMKEQKYDATSTRINYDTQTWVR